MKSEGVIFHGEPKVVPGGKDVGFEDLYGNQFDLIQVPHPIYRSFEKLKAREVFTGYKLIGGFPFWNKYSRINCM